MSDFIDSFNSALPDLEASFGEDWVLEKTGMTWPAISIDHESRATNVMKGGQIQVVDTTIYIREDVFTNSGVEDGDYVTIRGQEFSVLTIEQDGDAARMLSCVSPQIDVWG